MNLTTDNHQLTTISPGYFVYIMSDGARKTFYIGVTGFLLRKIKQHSGGTGYEDNHASSHVCRDLVYLEQYGEAQLALEREQKIRNWGHTRIEALVTGQNPQLKTLNEELEREQSTLL